MPSSARCASGSLGAALGFGVMMGLALNSKYYALTLAATCWLAGAGERANGGRYFRSASPYVSAARRAGACWAPHLIWLANTGAPPMRYLARVSGRGFGEAVAFAGVGGARRAAAAGGRVGPSSRLRARPPAGSVAECEDRRLLLDPRVWRRRRSALSRRWRCARKFRRTC